MQNLFESVVMKNKFDAQICGIDEAGRGALAGPLAVAACVLKREIAGLNDSKKTDRKAARAAVWPDRQKLGLSHHIFFKQRDRRAGS